MIKKFHATNFIENEIILRNFSEVPCNFQNFSNYYHSKFYYDAIMMNTQANDLSCVLRYKDNHQKYNQNAIH